MAAAAVVAVRLGPAAPEKIRHIKKPTTRTPV
jgi:hypothetical protein